MAVSTDFRKRKPRAARQILTSEKIPESSSSCLEEAEYFEHDHDNHDDADDVEDVVVHKLA